MARFADFLLKTIFYFFINYVIYILIAVYMCDIVKDNIKYVTFIKY